MHITRSTLLGALFVAGLGHAASAQPTEEVPPAEPVPVEPAPVEPAPAEPDPPVAAPVAAPVVAAPVEEFDLGAIGLDATTAFDDKLNIYGFVDFTYAALHVPRPNPIFSDTRSFGVGNLNLYLSKNLTRKWRTLAEVRMLFAPNGSTNPDGTVTNTTTKDPGNGYRPIEWGGIRIERVYLEYDLHPKLTVRAGRFLSPYGIWNIDHGSPTIIPTLRPYVIGEQFIPEHQTGIELFGSHYLDEYRIDYHATVSNGRSPAEATQDPDRKLAFGGRLAFTAPLAGTLTLGVSAYRGRASSLPTTIGADPEVVSDEVAYAADAVWNHGGFLAQGEIMVREREFLVGKRKGRAGGFLPNGRDFGWYVLAGYRFDAAWQVMPFAMVEYYRPLEGILFEVARQGSVGLNFRPAPTIVLKAMATMVDTTGAGSVGSLDRLHIYTGQAAWVF
jgi:hypothetical protein